MVVISDSGPLIYLGSTGQLELLRALYGEVVVPQEVMDEVTVAGAGDRGAAEVASCPFLRVEPVPLRHPVRLALARVLDAGEAAALALAVELNAELVLMDERKGRHAARDLGLRVRGTIGVLLDAKRAGELVSVRSALDAVRGAGMWISDALYEEALALAGEERDMAG